MTMKTLHGCTCLKDWVKIDGKKYSGCVYGQAAESECPMTTDKEKLNKRCPIIAQISSCPVEEGCGTSFSSAMHESSASSSWHKRSEKSGVLIDSSYWDICEPNVSGGFGHPTTPSVFFKMSRLTNIKAIIGLILYLGFAGFFIPHVLYRTGHNTLVDVWIPNIDLMAHVFTFRGGLFDSNFFRFLYTDIPDTTFGFWSQLIIDYFALLGLTLITASMVYRRKSISGGMSYAIIMLILSYLIPNTMIETIMNKIYTYLDSNRTTSPTSLWTKWRLNTQISIFCGFVVVACFLLMERFLINNHLHMIDKLSSFLVNKVWYNTWRKHIKKRKK